MVHITCAFFFFYQHILLTLNSSCYCLLFLWLERFPGLSFWNSRGLGFVLACLLSTERIRICTIWEAYGCRHIFCVCYYIIIIIIGATSVICFCFKLLSTSSTLFVYIIIALLLLAASSSYLYLHAAVDFVLFRFSSSFGIIISVYKKVYELYETSKQIKHYILYYILSSLLLLGYSLAVHSRGLSSSRGPNRACSSGGGLQQNTICLGEMAELVMA